MRWCIISARNAVDALSLAAVDPWRPPALTWAFLQVGGAAVMAVGVWTLVEKSGYLSILASSTFAASAYILIFAGALVMVTGFLGFGAIIREDRGCLSTVSALLESPACTPSPQWAPVLRTAPHTHAVETPGIGASGKPERDGHPRVWCWPRSPAS